MGCNFGWEIMMKNMLEDCITTGEMNLIILGGQDGLKLTLKNCILRVSERQNNVSHTNKLYFEIEHPTILSTEDIKFESEVKLFPNLF